MAYAAENVLEGLAKEFGRNKNTIRMWLSELQERGFEVQRPYSTAKGSKPPSPEDLSKYDYSFSDRGECAEVTAQVDKRITSERDLVEFLKIDTDVWKIKKFTVGKSEAYRKDREVVWDVSDGKVVNGQVRDSGKLIVQPLYSVKVWLERKTGEIRSALAIADIKEDLKKLSTKVPKLKYPKMDGGLLLEIEMPDAHVGKLTWGEESGENSDLKSQSKRMLETVQELLSYAKEFNIERILFPVGNDYYNVDNAEETTAGGTKQQEDTRWAKTFRAGRILAVEMIELCLKIAPVDVIVIPGNHDTTRSFYLGDSIETWFHGNPNVTVNNLAKSRKYYRYGQSLIGLTHGSEEKPSQLSGLMSMEAPQDWVATRFREWHLGHVHHKEDMVFKTKEDCGVTVRYLRSLSPTDAWHFKRGYIGALQASEAFLWSKDKGLIAQFTSVAKPNEE